MDVLGCYFWCRSIVIFVDKFLGWGDVVCGNVFFSDEFILFGGYFCSGGY